MMKKFEKVNWTAVYSLGSDKPSFSLLTNTSASPGLDLMILWYHCNDVMSKVNIWDLKDRYALKQLPVKALCQRSLREINKQITMEIWNVTDSRLPPYIENLSQIKE